MEKEICNICNEILENSDGWTWCEDPAHKKCVIDSVNYVCGKCNEYYQTEGDGMCQNCGEEDNWKYLTKKEKEKIKNNPNL